MTQEDFPGSVWRAEGGWGLFLKGWKLRKEHYWNIPDDFTAQNAYCNIREHGSSGADATEKQSYILLLAVPNRLGLVSGDTCFAPSGVTF
jgi:hypothetical protein